MNYVHPNFYAEHWLDIKSMVFENYRKDLNPNDIILIGNSAFQNIDEIKFGWPNYDRYIAYQLEPLAEGHWHATDKILRNLSGADEVWDYDLENIEFLKKNGIEAKYKPFLYTESLKRVQNVEELDIDVLFFGSLTENRLQILKSLSLYLNCNIMILKSFLNKKLDEFIARSKIVLDLHTEDRGIQKQSRIFYCLINNKCVLSEKSNFNFFGDLIIETKNNNFVSSINLILENKIWKNYLNVSERYKNLSEHILKKQTIEI